MLLKKELGHATGVDTFDLVALNAKVDGLDISKLVNVQTCLNNVLNKVDDSVTGKMKNFPVEF